MGNFRGWEWILILLLALLLFGGFKKLPDAARGVGRSLRIFKAETKGLQDDETPVEASGELPTSDDSAALNSADAASSTSSGSSATEPKAASAAASDKTPHDSAS